MPPARTSLNSFEVSALPNATFFEFLHPWNNFRGRHWLGSRFHYQGSSCIWSQCGCWNWARFHPASRWSRILLSLRVMFQGVDSRPWENILGCWTVTKFVQCLKIFKCIWKGHRNEILKKEGRESLPTTFQFGSALVFPAARTRCLWALKPTHCWSDEWMNGGSWCVIRYTRAWSDFKPCLQTGPCKNYCTRHEQVFRFHFASWPSILSVVLFCLAFFSL